MRDAEDTFENPNEIRETRNHSMVRVSREYRYPAEYAPPETSMISWRFGSMLLNGVPNHTPQRTPYRGAGMVGEYLGGI